LRQHLGRRASKGGCGYYTFYVTHTHGHKGNLRPLKEKSQQSTQQPKSSSPSLTPIYPPFLTSFRTKIRTPRTTLALFNPQHTTQRGGNSRTNFPPRSQSIAAWNIPRAPCREHHSVGRREGRGAPRLPVLNGPPRMRIALTLPQSYGPPKR
jgi:hypothetical protein